MKVARKSAFKSATLAAPLLLRAHTPRPEIIGGSKNNLLSLNPEPFKL
jgi:hypothetical protein